MPPALAQHTRGRIAHVVCPVGSIPLLHLHVERATATDLQFITFISTTQDDRSFPSHVPPSRDSPPPRTLLHLKLALPAWVHRHLLSFVPRRSHACHGSPQEQEMEVVGLFCALRHAACPFAW